MARMRVSLGLLVDAAADADAGVGVGAGTWTDEQVDGQGEGNGGDEDDGEDDGKISPDRGLDRGSSGIWSSSRALRRLHSSDFMVFTVDAVQSSRLNRDGACRLNGRPYWI